MLDRVLDEISRRTPFFQGGAIMGADGIPLLAHPVDGGPDLDQFSAECSALVKNLTALTSLDECGALRGVAAVGERWNLVLERITPEYYLLLVTGAEAPLGHCRYLLRRAALDLEPELA